MTNETTVLYELTDHTARITLNRPDKLNAINTEMREGLAEALRRFESEEDAWIGVFAGAGGNFSVGLDLSEADPESLDDEASKSIENLYVALSGIWKPTIALVGRVLPRAGRRHSLGVRYSDRDEQGGLWVAPGKAGSQFDKRPGHAVGQGAAQFRVGVSLHR